MGDEPARTPCPNPDCGKLLRVAELNRGRSLKCPRCGTVFVAPAAADALLQPPDPLPPLLDANPYRPDPLARVDRAVAGAAAVVIHAVLLILFLLVGSAGGGPPAAGAPVGFAQLDTESLTNTDDGVLDDSAAGGGGDPGDTLTTTVELGVAAPAADAAGLDLSVAAAGGGGSGGAGGGDGFGFGSKGGAGGQATFLGTTAQGSRFCIVADNSGSMSGPPLEYVKQEILKTLTEARGGAKFHVVFFNSRAEPQPLAKWVNGKAEVGQLASWIQTVTARGGTEPITGFDVALRLNPPPDVVYFMTDGGFDPQQVKQIDALNKALKKPAVIHSICFLNNAGERQLREIAANAKGTYRFVPGFRRP